MNQFFAFMLFTCFSLNACATTTMDDNKAVELSAKAIKEYNLTSVKIECLYFDTEQERTDYLVRVREKHNAECGGSPETSPTLFFIKIRKSDGKATTTAYGIDGSFKPLSHDQHSLFTR